MTAMPSRINKTEPPLSRRDFLVKSALTSSLALGAGALGFALKSDKPVRRGAEKIRILKDFRAPPSPTLPALALVRGQDVDRMVRAAVEKLGGIKRFIKPGDKVLIKPNVGWDRQPEQAANTNPEVVAAVVKLCREAQAEQILVTDGSINNPHRSFARSGIEKAAQDAGAEVRFATVRDFTLTDMKGQILKIWPVSRFYHEADKIINIPLVKHHSLSRCTIAMKNWYGVLGGRRNRLHQSIDVSIADLASALRPTLTVVDATRVLMRNGPTGGNLADVAVMNTVLAGTDEVALDSRALEFLKLRPDQVPFLGMGEKRGLGKIDWKSQGYAELQLG